MTDFKDDISDFALTIVKSVTYLGIAGLGFVLANGIVGSIASML